jgi:ATP-dependent DNA helicase RecG
MVEIFDDRVDIVNPGGLCKGITPENFGTVTITRNPIIASMFFRIDYIEQMGTGIERMRNSAREANVAEPIFEFSGFFKVTFKRDDADTSIGRQSVAIGRDDR